MAFTVTATGGGVSFQRGVDLYVRVLTNAAESGGATSGGANAAAGTAQGSLTPNFSSSYVAFSVSSDGITSMPAAATSNTYDYAPAGHTDTWVAAMGHYSGTVTSGSALTYGAGSAGAGDHENWCAYEIPASGGTVTVDGSSPAGVFGDTSASSTTAAFSPPVGAVLVAMVVTGGSGAGAGQTPSVSDSSGTGMVWTRRAISSTSDNFQVTSVFTATVPPQTTPFTRSAEVQTSRTWQRRWNHFVRPAIPPQVQQVTVHAGVAAASASAMPPPGFMPFIYQLGGSGYNAWFADQQGNPRLMLLEQAWALPWNAGRWNSGDWQSDYTAYFSRRSAQGYNAWYGVVWGNSHVDSAALSGGRSWDGVYPLTVNGTPGAIATGAETVALNGTFWARIDAFIATAMKYGTAVFVNLSMSYDISDVGGIWQHATNTQATAFGSALASRYPVANWPNLHWFWGDDDDGPNDSFYSAILTGIRNAGDTRPLISIEQFTNTNSHIAFSSGGAFSGSFGGPNATYNWVYSYDAPYFGCEESYTEGGTFTHIPPVYGDGVYYGDTGTGTTADRAIRNFTWWALSSGSRGVPSTSGPSDLGANTVWAWNYSGAQAAVASDPNGTWTTGTIGAIASYVSGLADWNKLIPDTGNVFITAGRGTRGTCDAAGGVFNFRNTSNYVAGSITPNGTLAVIYCKASMSITIDQTKMGAGYTATWVDPASLATQSAATGTTYASGGLGNNSAGDPDWVLVLQAPPSASATAGAAAAFAAAKAPAPAVTVTAGVAAAAAAAPAPVTAVTAVTGAGTVLAAAPAPALAGTATSGVAVALAADPGATVSASAGTSANAGVAAVSAAAPAAAAAAAATAGAATAQAAATAATAAETAAAGVPAVTAAAPQPSAAETVNAAVPAAQGTAPQPSVSTSGSTSAPAAVATAAAAANPPAAAIATRPVAAAAASTAAAPSAAAAGSAAAAASTATAPQASVTTVGSGGASPAAATGQGAAPAPAVQVKVNAGVAASAGTAPAATRPVFADVATAAAAAPAAVLAALAAARAAAALAQAPAAAGNAVIPAVFGTATPGGSTVTAATASSTPAVTATAGGQP